ncbi:MAG: transglutaminase domain-containing protein [Hungatella sp.]|nr:transglutaminase domain-containing protein [Hungatella sp.]
MDTTFRAPFASVCRSFSEIYARAALLCGCSGKGGAGRSGSGTLRDNTPQVLTPQASGTVVYGNDYIDIDASHTEEGYFMVKYKGDNEKVKLRMAGPGGEEYYYLLSDSGEYETFPLPCGSGDYQVQILENITGDNYAIACSADLQVSVGDELRPFLYPNQYVNFSPDSQAVAKGKELAENTYSELDVITNVYHYIIGEITYDEEKARNVAYGYLPVIDETLSSGKGICFDYAALMSAMLRSQGIPTKLEIGYAGEAYHAWISTYIAEIGWVDKIIEFDGTSWVLMDPTLGANNDRASVAAYIGDGSKYMVKYSY